MRQTSVQRQNHFAHIIGCMKATIKWQELIGIKGEKAIRLTAPNLSDVLFPDVAAETT
jgi:hypothetical protein